MPYKFWNELRIQNYHLNRSNQSILGKNHPLTYPWSKLDFLMFLWDLFSLLCNLLFENGWQVGNHAFFSNLFIFLEECTLSRNKDWKDLGFDTILFISKLFSTLHSHQSKWILYQLARFYSFSSIQLNQWRKEMISSF